MMSELIGIKVAVVALVAVGVHFLVRHLHRRRQEAHRGAGPREQEPLLEPPGTPPHECDQPHTLEEVIAGPEDNDAGQEPLFEPPPDSPTTQDGSEDAGAPFSRHSSDEEPDLASSSPPLAAQQPHQIQGIQPTTAPATDAAPTTEAGLPHGGGHATSTTSMMTTDRAQPSSITLFSSFIPPLDEDAHDGNRKGAGSGEREMELLHAADHGDEPAMLDPSFSQSMSSSEGNSRPHSRASEATTSSSASSIHALQRPSVAASMGFDAPPTDAFYRPLQSPFSPAASSSLSASLEGGISSTRTLAEELAMPPRDVSFNDWAGVPRGVGLDNMERSGTLRSTVSDRRLPRVEEGDAEGADGGRTGVDAPVAAVAATRSSLPAGEEVVDVPLALKIDVIAGPCSHTSYVSPEHAKEVTLGRAPENALVLHDGEVSSKHALLSWNAHGRCWQVCDLGSLNGTLLNAEAVVRGSGQGRERGPEYRLSTDDVLQLGSATRVKISVFPREMLPENTNVRLSLSLSLGGSLPHSLTMPKHRIPSFTSLLSPKITSHSPSKRAVVAAASDELRLECCIAFATGREHARRGQLCEDVATAECPLRGSETALQGNPAALFCVFDGHCGRGAAEAACAALPEEIAMRLPAATQASMVGMGPSEEGNEIGGSEGGRQHGVPMDNEMDGSEGTQGAGEEHGARAAAPQQVERGGGRRGAPPGVAPAFREAFLATDDRIASEEGCTATAVLAWLGSQGQVLLQAANVGDSAALLLEMRDGVVPRWKALTEDHRLTNPAERDRLAQAGIPLSSTTRRLYGLNLSRALGDRFLKDEDLGLSAEPYVSDLERIGADRGALLLIASDGVWDVLDMDRVVSIVASADAENDGNVVDVASAVVSAAQKAGSRDDVTALVARLWPADEWLMRSPIKNLDDGREASFEMP